MSKYREEICKSYVCYGEECKKGREADHNGYCQKCGLYEPRMRRKHVNMKKRELDKVRKKEME